MIVTRRFLWLVALGIVPLLASYAIGPLAYGAVLWNVLVIAAAICDYLLCPNPDGAVSVVREVGEVLSVAAENAVTLRVRNQTRQPLPVVVRDEPPGVFDFGKEGSAGRQKAKTLAPFEMWEYTYHVVPPARGDFVFRDIFLRVTGPLGLITRQGIILAEKSVAVYPNLRAVEDYEIMLRRAMLSRQGVRRMRTVGAGREFASLRDYTPDDEYRTIDWKATARRGKVISRTYEQEKSQDILLLIDQGRLMRQEIGHTQKLDHVVSAALMLAHVVAEADDRVGLLTFSDDAKAWLPPARGRSAYRGILEALYASRAEPVESDYRSAFRFLATRWRKRSLAVVFTDLADPESSAVLLQEIGHLSHKHVVVCVVVSDPLIGERARQMPATPESVYEKAVAEEVIAERRRALNLLKKRGVLIVDAEPHELSVELISRYLLVKSRSLL